MRSVLVAAWGQFLRIWFVSSGSIGNNLSLSLLFGSKLNSILIHWFGSLLLDRLVGSIKSWHWSSNQYSRPDSSDCDNKHFNEDGVAWQIRSIRENYHIVHWKYDSCWFRWCWLITVNWGDEGWILTIPSAPPRHLIMSHFVRNVWNVPNSSTLHFLNTY